MLRNLALIFACLTVTLLSTGCGPEIPARFELDEDKTLVILPASDPEFGRGYFTSPRGRQIAEFASANLSNEISPDFIIPPEKYLERFDRMSEKVFDPNRPLHERVRDDLLDPNDMTEQQIADKIKCDYIVFVDIADDGWSVRPDGSINVLKGRARMSVRVYDNQGLKIKLLGTEIVNASYPRSFYERDGITSFDGDEGSIEEGLKESAGVTVARLFYEHDKDDSYRLTLE